MVSEKCKVVLGKKPVCRNGYEVFTGQRRYVMCRAFQLLEAGEAPDLGTAIKMSWEEVHKVCGVGGSMSEAERIELEEITSEAERIYKKK